MSSREKKLISLFLLAGFLVLNFFLYSLYQQKKELSKTDLNTAKLNLEFAINNQKESSQFADQMQWLIENEPAPTDAETVRGQLQVFADTEARQAGLTVKRQEFLTTDTSGTHYHRAQITFTVTGEEQDLYRWLNTINDPNAFRAAIQIRLSPNTTEDTLIDCSVLIAQWFPAEKPDS